MSDHVEARGHGRGACPVAHLAGLDPARSPVEDLAAAFDPFQDAYMENTSEFLRWARERAPMFYSPEIGYWVVTRYDAIRSIFRDPHTFSPSIVLEPVGQVPKEFAEVLQSYGYAMNRTLVNEDEPAHMARRRALMEPFTPEALESQVPMVRRLVTEAIDGFIDRGEADLVKEMLWDVPFSVALHFLGIDDDGDREEMHRFAIAHTKNAFGRPTDEERIEVAHSVGQFWQLSGRILDRMRRTPDGPGWMRYSIRQQREFPDVVTDSYLHSMMMAIIVAAHETTSFGSANAIKLLLQQRDVWDELCADSTLISPAVEECLRHVGPIASWRRRTTREVEIEGVRIPAGSRLLMVVASANHDGRKFHAPDFFDIRRDNVTDHLSFGFGVHQCLGKNIARMEMQIFVGELTRRLPHLRLAEQAYRYVHNLSFRGPQNLRVEWDPAHNPERRDPRVREGAQEIVLGPPHARNLVRQLEVVAAERVTPDIVRVRVRNPSGQALPGWTAGSHIDVQCGDTGLSRQYSLCGDLERTDEWAFAVLREPQGRGGSEWIHRYATPGATLKVRGPRNHFRMNEGARRLLLIAGGIGITPIMAMAQRARALGKDYELHYSCSTRRDAAFLAELEGLHGARFHLHVSDEGSRNDLDALLAQPDDHTDIHACGPSRMLEALHACVARAGWRPHALNVEHFVSDMPKLDPAKERSFEIELRHSGLTLQVPPDKTVLEVLNASNVDVQCDCREGLCGTCEVGVLEGEIDHRDVVLNPGEHEANNRMMTCCSRARSGRLVLDL